MKKWINVFFVGVLFVFPKLSRAGGLASLRVAIPPPMAENVIVALGKLMEIKAIGPEGLLLSRRILVTKQQQSTLAALGTLGLMLPPDLVERVPLVHNPPDRERLIQDIKGAVLQSVDGVKTHMDVRTLEIIDSAGKISEDQLREKVILGLAPFEAYNVTSLTIHRQELAARRVRAQADKIRIRLMGRTSPD